MRKALLAATIMIGTALAPGLSAAAHAATKSTRTRAFSEVAVGAMISTTGNRFEKVFRIKRSPDGGGGAIQDGVLGGVAFPVSGHDTMELFFRDGMQMTADTFTLGPADLNGLGTITGSGKCTTGTGLHQGERCNFKITGTYDLLSTVTRLTLTGTFTR